MPDEIAIARAGYAEAIAAKAPADVLSVILGTEAYYWSTHIRRTGAPMAAASWEDLMARARHTGIAVPTGRPRTTREALVVLESIRRSPMA